MFPLLSQSIELLQVAGLDINLQNGSIYYTRVARGPKFVTKARNFKLTRPAAKFSARKKPA